MMTLQDIARATAGKVLAGDPTLSCQGVSTDTRSIAAGQLFVALRGDNFDGHDYLGTARERGAAAALIDEKDAAALHAQHPQLPLVAVADSRRALGALAAWWRRRFALPVIAVTGSNGKTTTKEMIAAILAADAQAAGRNPATTVLATRGNFNNDIGLPLTLLQLTAEHRAAVIEMGMNHPGEIAYLTGIAHPTVAAVTNAQRAHLAGMGDLAGVAAEKGTIYNGLGNDGIAVVNVDDAYAPLWLANNTQRRVLRCGVDQTGEEIEVSAQLQPQTLASNISLRTPQGSASFTLNIPGSHNARNAVVAAATAIAAGLPLTSIVAGLGAFSGVKGRLQRRPGPHGAVLLDDTYNANPDSVRAGIAVLAGTVGTRILVLGDMGEIGEASAQYHDEIGGYAKSMGIDLLFALGEQTALTVRNFGTGAAHFQRFEALVEALAAQLNKLDGPVTVLIKGSRFMRMERIADALASDGNGAAGEKH